MTPKKEWSDEDRKAFGEKMRQARVAKQQEKEAKAEVEEAVAQVPAAAVSTEEVVKQVLAEILRGGHKDNTDKTKQTYSVEPDDYDDPRERLANLPELKKYAFDQNYELEWKVEVANYPKADGQWYREPRFVLNLWRYPTALELEQAAEKGNKNLTPKTQIWVGQHMQSEDDVAAKTIAQRLGFKVGVHFKDFDELMDEMRFERMKQWLLSLKEFGGSTKSEEVPSTEMAISGRVVKVHNQGSSEEIVESEKIIRA